jgi:DNA-directed RNA polymerase, mitochondrial
MITRDRKAGRLVNLVDTGKPQDVYSAVGSRVQELLGWDKLGRWWRERFKKLTHKEIRKLVKRPVMTLPYNAGENPRRRQIAEEYYKLRKKGRFPKRKYPRGAMSYLAGKIEEAVNELLPGVVAGMKYITSVATQFANAGRFVEWVSPTGFSVSNRYQESAYHTLNLPGENGIKIRYRLADGVIPGSIVPEDCIKSCAPNFIHSMDASHLIRTVNACVADGITDLLCVHDCFSCHAPNAARLNQIIRRELAIMYKAFNAIAVLQQQCKSVIPPPLGKFDPLEVQNAEWLCI